MLTRYQACSVVAKQGYAAGELRNGRIEMPYRNGNCSLRVYLVSLRVRECSVRPIGDIVQVKKRKIHCAMDMFG